jgi:hypothetical protein
LHPTATLVRASNEVVEPAQIELVEALACAVTEVTRSVSVLVRREVHAGLVEHVTETSKA